jgi:hypothetical protein
MSAGEVREKGERTARVDPKRIGRLVQTATKLLNDHSPLPVRPSSGYCLMLKAGDGASMVTGVCRPVSHSHFDSRSERRQLTTYLAGCPRFAAATGSVRFTAKTRSRRR